MFLTNQIENNIPRHPPMQLSPMNTNKYTYMFSSENIHEEVFDFYLYKSKQTQQIRCVPHYGFITSYSGLILQTSKGVVTKRTDNLNYKSECFKDLYRYLLRYQNEFCIPSKVFDYFLPEDKT